MTHGINIYGIMAQGILDTLGDLKVNLQIPDKIQLPGATSAVDLRRMDKTIDTATDTMMHTAIALGIVVGGWFISSWLASFSQRALVRAHVELTVAAFLASMIRYAVFLTCMIASMRVMGVSFTSMVTIFGAIGLAVAFALRNTLSHVAAGLMLIVNRPFRVGDFIELEKMMGTVKRITIFNTEINTVQNQRVFMPNSKIWESILMNHTYNEVRLIEFSLGFAYDDNPTKCKKVLRKVFSDNELILTKPEPYVETHSFGDSDIRYNIRIAVRTKDFGTVRTVILDEIWQAAGKAGLTIPFPQRVVRMAATEEKSAATRKKRKSS